MLKITLKESGKASEETAKCVFQSVELMMQSVQKISLGLFDL